MTHITGEGYEPAVGDEPTTGHEFTTSDEPAGMTDLEEGLRGSDGARVAGECLRQIDRLIARNAASVSAGLAPGAFAAAQDLGNALAAAREIVVFATPISRDQGS